MYKLIIVDDEISAQNILKDYINDWVSGFEVAGCFNDGFEAAEYIKNNDVDVVLSDIKMPRMNGIELAEFIYNERPNIKVILISGYSEFSYAKKAIEFNVFNYLLKAVDAGELIDALERVKSVLDKEVKYKRIEDDSLKQCRERFFIDLMVGAITEKDLIRKRFNDLGIHFDIDKVYGKIYKFEFKNYEEILQNHWKYGKEHFNDAIAGVIDASIEEVLTASITTGVKDVMLILISENENLIDIEIIKSELLNVMGLKTVYRLIASFNSISEFIENDNLYSDEEIIKIMMTELKLGDMKNAKNIMRRIMKRTEGASISFNVNNTEKLNPLLKDGIKNGYDVDEIYIDVKSTEKSDTELINAAKAYIMQNFNKDISRSEVAEHFFFNEAYFGHYFKQKTGMTISDYLLEVRMKRAVELLNTNIKISDIIEKIGYRSARHFQRTFKNFSGYTPSEYRRKVLRMDSDDSL